MAANSQETANPADHLKVYRWKKGQSGSLSGRPKRLPISDGYRDRAEEVLPERLRKWIIKQAPQLGEVLTKGSTWGDLVVIAQFMQAMKGKTEAAREIREAVGGKSPQRLRDEGPDSGPIEVRAESIEEVKKRIVELQESILAKSKG
jgi:Family of unknown function (DUF5681)